MTPADKFLSDTRAGLQKKERLLDALRLPLTLVGAALGAAATIALAPVLGLTVGATVIGAIAVGAVSAVTSFGFVDKYASRYGLRALAVSGMETMRALGQAEEQIKQAMPLKDHAKKAFIEALTDGIRDKLHIRKPLQLKKPQP